jgi:lambda family phage tail tape measure protein
MIVPKSTETRVIRIIGDTKGDRAIKRMANSMGVLNNNTKSMASSFKFLRNASIGWFSVMRITDLVRMSDTMQLLGDRIEVLTDGQADAGETLSQLRDVADATQTSLNVTADSFTRMAAAIGDTRIKTKFLIGLTKVLQDSFLVAGASIKETTSTTVQLAQAFASGEVRGQELRSVMEQNATVARLLRKEYGKDIYKKAATGAITASDVLRILFENQEKLANQAKNIKPTIEKTIVAALNGLRITIFKLNRDYELSSKFAAILAVSLDKLSLVFTVIAVTSIPFLAKAITATLIPALAKLGASLLALSASNPFTLLAVGIGVAAIIIFKNLDELKGRFKQFEAFLSDLNGSILVFRQSIVSPFAKGRDSIIAGYDKQIDEAIKRSKDLRKEAADSFKKSDASRKGAGLLDKDFIQSQLDALKDIYGQSADKIDAKISLLNLAFKEGQLSVREYYDELNNAKIADITSEFDKGKISLEDYNKKLIDFKRIGIDREFNNGALSLQEYRKALDGLQLEDMRNQLAAGKITLVDFNKELLKTFNALDWQTYSAVFRDGSESFLSSLKTLGEGVAATITKSFSTLEDELLNLVKTGKFEFNRFAQSILDDLTRIVIRLTIVNRLAQAIAGLGGGPSFSGNQLPATGGGGGNLLAANGAAFDTGGIRKFANGGIFNSPTAFGYGGGRTGIMGESGPEAILPLSRSNGKLGVEASVNPVNINIINNSDTEITSTESSSSTGERNIEIVIETKVREGLSRGTYDKQLRSNFGISRKGF